MEITGNILSALKFAAESHKNQRRKDREESPYVNHIIEVTHILWHKGEVRDLSVLVAAILHDTLEDSDIHAKEIEGLFGREVRKYVEEVTDDKSLKKAERKRMQVITAPHKSHGAKLIKLADKAANVKDIAMAPPHKWTLEDRKRYLTWAKDVIDQIRGTNAALEAHFDKQYERGIRVLEKLAHAQAELSPK